MRLRYLLSRLPQHPCHHQVSMIHLLPHLSPNYLLFKHHIKRPSLRQQLYIVPTTSPSPPLSEPSQLLLRVPVPPTLSPQELQQHPQSAALRGKQVGLLGAIPPLDPLRLLGSWLFVMAP